ncbi:HAD hydrolase-like protein [Sphingomonas sp.]|uniref:HAD family hydrolase n=1 Tax=Sphingomonas sp. TaxID=28214 RepID=UPI00286A8087|nr:HAD hydrolase-like protein [Sphingomonas sp.]
MTAAVDIIFDLDGTLVDSVTHIAAILSEVAGREIKPSDARHYLTQGGEQLVSALLGDDNLHENLAQFRELYLSLPTPDCLYPGVRDGLDRLQDAGRTMAICSNKPQILCEKTVADLRLDHFAMVLGSAGKPGNIPLTASLYVGDSKVDQDTAALSDIPFAFVTYGYAEPGFASDDQSFDTFAEVVDFALQ